MMWAGEADASVEGGGTKISSVGAEKPQDDRSAGETAAGQGQQDQES